ncbi:MAG: PF20097 family protein [Phycisphaerae bacterium]
MDNIMCPNCGQEMTRGFIRAPNGIHWRTTSDPPLRWRSIGRALRNTLAWWSFRENPAWHCDTCEMLVVDHSLRPPAKRRTRGLPG